MKSFVINYPGERTPAQDEDLVKAADAISVLGAVKHDSTDADPNSTAVYIAVESLISRENDPEPLVWGEQIGSIATSITAETIDAAESPLGKPSVMITLNVGSN